MNPTGTETVTKATTEMDRPPTTPQAEEAPGPSSPSSEANNGHVTPMLLDFYGLREQPFGVTPDPAYLYPSRTHREALASLSYGIQNDRGFLALIAKPGMGKTTLLYQLLEELRGSARTAFLFQTQCTSREFFRYLLGELGVDTSGMDLFAMHDKLNQLLFSEMLAGKRFVLVVDEAQNLEDPVLETIRLLSNFETPHAKLLQIVLAGQPQLAEKLARHGLSQLRQRIAILSRLEPLSAEETVAYIEHRLKVAGYSGVALFAPDALAMIAERSQGIPRNINNLCFNALSLGYARRRKIIGRGILQEVVANLDVDSIARQLRSDGPPPIASASPAPLQLTYRPVGQLGWGRALKSILLLGGLSLLLPIGRLGTVTPSLAVPPANQQDANLGGGDGPPISAELRSPSTDSALKPMFGSAPHDAVSSRNLIVVAGPQQSLKEISLRYLGRFDQELLEEVCALNPGLKDPNQIEAGRLILLPLRAGTLRKVLDTAEAAGAPKERAEKTGHEQKLQAAAANQARPEFVAKRQDE